MNNPLRYTDPSGYNQQPDDWGAGWLIGSGPGYGGPIGPGSGSHWSDAFRSEYDNYMIGSASSFNKMYGSGASDIAWGLASNSALQNSWRQGMISIEKIRANGGYWKTTTYTLNSPTVYDHDGNLIIASLPTTVVFNQFIHISSAIKNDGEINNGHITPVEIGFKFNDAVDKAGTLTAANIYGAQKLAGIAVKDMAKLTGLKLIGRVTGITSMVDNYRISFTEHNVWKGIEATGQLGFMLFGGEEAELIYNLSTLTIDLTIDVINANNKNKQ